MADLQNQRALVTGAGRGIGRGCALALAEAGADLVVNDRPGSDDLEGTVEAARALGRECTSVEANVFDAAERERLMDAAGEIDILISVPAANHRAMFLDYKLEDFQYVINGTLTSGFHLGQLAARGMVECGRGGRIVFISSVHALMPHSLSVAYNAAKAGLNNLARTMAVELAGHRITVNAIEPGWIDTPAERESFGEAAIEGAGADLPLGRLGQPEDIGHAAAFLASPAAGYITGEVLRVDGGFWLKDCRGEEAFEIRNPPRV
jgi:glucose 1-dehydrogenase